MNHPWTLELTVTSVSLLGLLEEIVLEAAPISNRSRQKTIDSLSPSLVPGESIVFIGACLNWKPVMLDRFVLTDGRLLGMQGKEVNVSYRLPDLSSIELNRVSRQLDISQGGGLVMSFKSLRTDEFDDLEAAIASLDLSAEGDLAASLSAATEAQAASDASWVGAPPSSKERTAVRQLCNPGENPWLVIHAGISGLLVAFDDRAAIVKAGGATAFMAGSFGGMRVATFYFADITGIQYNAGLITGVLQILTASYDGSSNKDFWKGTNKSRNADSNDPFTLPNTLPLNKSEYKKFQPHIARLQQRVAEAKQMRVTVTEPQLQSPTGGMAAEIQKLADLKRQGLLSDDEFAQAKAKLIAGS